MFQEELYLKKQLVTFIKELIYVVGITPLDEISKKISKLFVKTRLLMKTRTNEDRKVILVSLWYSYPLPSI